MTTSEKRTCSIKTAAGFIEISIDAQLDSSAAADLLQGAADIFRGVKIPWKDLDILTYTGDARVQFRM